MGAQPTRSGSGRSLSARPSRRCGPATELPSRQTGKRPPVDEALESDGTTEPRPGLGGAVLDGVTLAELLQGAVLLARRALPSAHSVSITVADGGAYRTSNTTGDEALVIDKAQYEGDGARAWRP